MKVSDYVREAEKKTSEFKHFKEKIFKHTLKWEGGGKLHNVPGDSGGWTVWGIAYNYNTEIFSNLADFKDTTYDEAAAIAFVKYYLAIRADSLPSKLKLIYFDTAYNMGNKRAIKILQKCAGVSQDGLVGPMTLAAARNVQEECLYVERNAWYNYLAMTNFQMQRFLKGWLARSKDIYEQE